VGLILSLAHFLDECSVQRTLDTVVERDFGDDSPFYIRMGAAWLFAEALCRHYDTALPYIRERRLSRWINNKAIQKARESFRIAPELKDYLNTLKF
ncbi:MAG: DNA alkylation repair protein, partial [Bacteroidales bacterium]|nr:DNA alkylation repair protein [Bacteroidales bacterium]